MSAEFFDILPPPQTVDTLDAWGDLDSLPWSLDSAKWLTVGVYGFLASEGGQSGGKLSVANITRGLELTGAATTSGVMLGVKVSELAGQDTAQSGQTGAVDAIRGLNGKANAQSGGDLTYLTIRAIFDTEPAVSGGSMLGVKVSYLVGTALAVSGGELEANFTRSLGGTGEALSAGAAQVGRVLMQTMLADGQTGGEALFTFKGWDWEGETEPPAPEWEPETVQPEPWVQEQRNAAEWAAQSVPAGSWTQKPGGAAQWR